MKTHHSLLGVVGMISAGALATSKAGEYPALTSPDSAVSLLSGSLSVGYDSMYNFRGVDFGSDAIWSEIDLNIDLSDTVGLNFGTWYTNPTGSIGGSDATDELDLYAFLTTSIGAIDVSVGGVAFFFTEAGATAQEIGFELGYSPVDALSLGFAYFYDLETEGSYLELNAGTSFELTDTLAIELGGGISYGDSYYGVSGFNHAFASASIPIAITDALTLTPYIASTWSIDGLEDLGEGDHLYGGASLSVGF